MVTDWKYSLNTLCIASMCSGDGIIIEMRFYYCTRTKAAEGFIVTFRERTLRPCTRVVFLENDRLAKLYNCSTHLCHLVYTT